MANTKKRVGILISGRGSNMLSLIAAARDPAFPAEIVCVLSNRPEAEGLRKAQCAGIRAHAIDHAHFKSRTDFEVELDKALGEAGVDLVACAGFMRLMTPAFVERWRDHMLNIHPSLLPAFPGLHTHERVLAAGVKITGCTVHVVRAEVDDGPILAQAAVPVRDGDTTESLAAHVLEAEHQLYPHALALFASGRVQVVGEKVVGPQVSINQEKALFCPPLG
jgi:phosphoribosylglycinamide formyltransferase-1